MRATAIERFNAKWGLTLDGCWQWTAYLNAGGYGMFGDKVRGKRFTWLAHRWSYEHFVGPIPEGLTIDHLCRNRACVNPAHLEPVTQRENVLRGETIPAAHAAKTHCPQGHEYDEANTYVYPSGRHRECRQCKVTSTANYRRKQNQP